MNAIKLKFICTASSKKDCRYWSVMPVKKRCEGCEIYLTGGRSEKRCGGVSNPCDWFYPCCRYDENGQCRYTLLKVNKMVLEFKKMGVVVELKGEKK